MNIHATHRNHDPTAREVPAGPEGVRRLVELYRAAFPDLHFEHEDVISLGDRRNAGRSPAPIEARSWASSPQKHLKETRDHKRRVGRRIKALNGSATSGPDVPGVPDAIGEAAGKAVAAVKGQIGAARAAATEQAETHLRNAQEELREEHVEIVSLHARGTVRRGGRRS